MNAEEKYFALEDCLRRMQAGQSLEEALAAYPQGQDELRPVLETAQAARALQVAAYVPRGALARSRARMLAAAAERPRHSPLGILLGRRLAPALVVLVACLALGLVGTGLASAKALPGDAFYPLKLASERTRLFFASDQAQRLELEQSFDRQRALEAEQLLKSNRRAEVVFAGFLEEDAEGRWTVSGVPLQFGGGAGVDPAYQPGTYVEVHGAPQADGAILVGELKVREIHFTGRLEEFHPAQWVVDGVTLALADDTQITGTPRLGELVVVRAIRRSDDVLQARWLRVLTTGKKPAATSSAKQPTVGSPQDEQPRVDPSATLEPEDPTATLEPSSTPRKGRPPTQVSPTDEPGEGATRTPEASKTPKPSKTPSSESPSVTLTPTPTDDD